MAMAQALSADTANALFLTILKELRNRKAYFQYVFLVSLPVYVKTEVEIDKEEPLVITDGVRVLMRYSPRSMDVSIEDYTVSSVITSYLIASGVKFALDALISDASLETKLRNAAFLFGNLYGIAKALKLTKDTLKCDCENVFQRYMSLTPINSSARNIEVISEVFQTNFEKTLREFVNDVNYLLGMGFIEIEVAVDGKNVDLDTAFIPELVRGAGIHKIDFTVTNKVTGKSLSGRINIVFKEPSEFDKEAGANAALVNTGSIQMLGGPQQQAGAQLAKAVKNAVERAKEVASRMSSKPAGVGVTDGFEYEFDEIVTSGAESLMQAFAALMEGLGGPKNIPTWSRLSRRLPSIKPGKVSTSRPMLVVIMDTSGSMYTDKSIDKVLNEMIRVVTQTRADVIWIQYSDGPAPPEELSHTDVIKMKTERKALIKQSGGTMIKDALKLAVEVLKKSSLRRRVAVLILSDGWIGDAADVATLGYLRELIGLSRRAVFLSTDVIPPSFREIEKESGGKFLTGLIRVVA